MHNTQAPSRDRDYEQFTAALVANQPAILGFIRTLMPGQADAEDVLQKTCLIAWQKFDQYDPETKFSTWACQIAYFEVKNFLRTRARDRHVFSDAVLDQLAQETPRDHDRLAAERAALVNAAANVVGERGEYGRQRAAPFSVLQCVALLPRGAVRNELFCELPVDTRLVDYIRVEASARQSRSGRK